VAEAALAGEVAGQLGRVDQAGVRERISDDEPLGAAQPPQAIERCPQRSCDPGAVDLDDVRLGEGLLAHDQPWPLADSPALREPDVDVDVVEAAYVDTHDIGRREA